MAFAVLSAFEARAAEEQVDLSSAVVYSGPGLRGEMSDALLIHEVETRTGIRLTKIDDPTQAGNRPIIRLGKLATHLAWAGPFGEIVGRAGTNSSNPEGFRIETGASGVMVAGVGDRGLLYGVGRLLRELRLSAGAIRIPKGFHVSTEPKTKLRGHQLGYRAKTNSYDAWDKFQWDRYIRELALFGTNAIELVPPRTDDDLTSPHFPAPPLEMMAEMSLICDKYDMDVWIWFPVMNPIDTEPGTIDALLKEWDEVFRKLKRVDAVFVPGGDPGHVPPKPLFDFLAKAKGVLKDSHPKAEMWVSPQGFDAKLFDEFINLAKAKPAWLDGIVFGPQVREFLPELRKSIPSNYPIRGYPDITHSRQCQHPVPDWDLAYAVTEGRESINPRPVAQAALVKAYRPETVGFISYSEGCNDDVNKFVWSGQAWDPEADVNEVLRQYARLFIGESYAESFAQVLLSLERNWSGPLLINAEVETTLKQIQNMERSSTPVVRQNWRFQQAVYRAYYDAYLRDRLIQETALEAEATAQLRKAGTIGVNLAIERSQQVLNRSLTSPVALDRRARVFELGEALFQSIHMQLSKPKYLAIDPERGANLDTIDAPLNNRVWLARQFAEITALKTEAEKHAKLDALLSRENPGPGGYYDQLGDPANSRHLVRSPTTLEDPTFRRATFHGFSLRTDIPVAWRRYAHTFYDAPLMMKYEGLDKTGTYKLRVVYSGDSPKARMNLQADDVIIHKMFAKPDPIEPVEFVIPRQLTADGTLVLVWNQEAGRGGNGRGNQVAEVWLIPLTEAQK